MTLASGRLDGYGYSWVQNPRSSGSTYDPGGHGYPWRFVLHTIESRSIPRTDVFPYPPHVWVSAETGQKIQNVPLTRAAFALEQPAWAPFYTNRGRALQVEIAGFAAEAASWPTSKLVWLVDHVLVPFAAFVEQAGGRVDLSDDAVPLAGPHTGYGASSAQRLNADRWIRGPVGLVGHRHAPGNQHWDAGQLDLRRVRDLLVDRLGGAGHNKPIPTEPRRTLDVPEARLRRDPHTGDPIILPWDGFPAGVIVYDLTLVPAGATIGVGFDPAWGTPSAVTVNAAATANGVDIASRLPFGPGVPAQFPVKGNREVAVLVHAVPEVLPPGGATRGWDTEARVRVVAV